MSIHDGQKFMFFEAAQVLCKLKVIYEKCFQFMVFHMKLFPIIDLSFKKAIKKLNIFVKRWTSIPTKLHHIGHVPMGSRKILLHIKKKTIQPSHNEGRQWQQDFLFLYQSTLPCSTNESSSSLLFKRTIRNKLSSLDKFLKSSEPQAVSSKIDANSNVKIEIGNNDLMKQIKRNKLSAHFSPYPMQVVHMHGSQVTTKRLTLKSYLAEIMAFSKKINSLITKEQNVETMPKPSNYNTEYDDVTTITSFNNTIYN